jgi:hypothetical protein
MQLSYRNLYLLHLYTPVEQLKEWLWNDRSLVAYDDRNVSWRVVKQFLKEHDLKIPTVNKRNEHNTDFRTNGYDFDVEDSLFFDGWEQLGNQSDDFVKFFEFIESAWGKLDSEQQNVATVLHQNHHSVFLSWLLVTGICSAPEYALMILNSLGQQPTDDFEDGTDWNRSHYTQYLYDANICAEYLRLSENPIKTLIDAGETKTVEFKSSFRWSVVEKRTAQMW